MFQPRDCSRNENPKTTHLERAGCSIRDLAAQIDGEPGRAFEHHVEPHS